jgi:hypothetical protein
MERERGSHKCCALVPPIRRRSRDEERHGWPPPGVVSGEEKIPVKKMREKKLPLPRKCLREGKKEERKVAVT